MKLLLNFAAPCLFLAAAPLGATVYQVSNSGSDSNDGITAPWKTLQKGVDALRRGDTLRVLAGEYLLERSVTIKWKNATEEAPILIEAQGAVVLRDGADKVDPWQGMIDIRDSSWITIRGFSLQQSGFFGVYMERDDHITVERCATNESVASGIAAWTSSQIVIRDNDIRAACNRGEIARGRGCQEHISLDRVQGFLVERNRVHDAQQSGKAHWGGGEGIDVKNGSSHGIVRNNEIWNLVELGLYVDAWRTDIHDVEIHGNRVHHCANGIALNSEQTGALFDIRVHDNLSYANGGQGIGVWRSGKPVTRVQIVNNTVVGNGVSSSKPYFLPPAEKIDKGAGIEAENPRTSGLVIRDNISFGNLGPQLVVDSRIPGAVVEHNLIGPALGGGIAGDHPVTSDPMFVDAARFDFRLKARSPAIDAGIGNQAPGSTDAWGNPRLTGQAVDIGAFEFGN